VALEWNIPSKRCNLHIGLKVVIPVAIFVVLAPDREADAMADFDPDIVRIETGL
jgi:hypothetical protein